jgi:F-type H+-transporting ATPase subunit delta
MTAMNAGKPFAREYARVLDALPAEEKEAVRSYFRGLHDQAERENDLGNFLDHPAISVAEKLKFIESTAPRRFSTVVGRVLADILRRRMTFLFPSIADEMQRLSDEAAGIHKVEVRSASPLSDPQRSELTARLKEYCGGSVEVRFAVDGSLAAGISIQTGDTVLDNSLRTDFAKIRRQLMAVSST